MGQSAVGAFTLDRGVVDVMPAGQQLTQLVRE